MTSSAQFPPRVLSMARLGVGVLRHYLQGRTPDSAYQSMVSLFCQSGGASNDFLSRLVSLLDRPYALNDANGILGDLNRSNLARITERLDDVGYYVFERRLPAPACDRLLDFAVTHVCVLRPLSNGGPAAASRRVGHYNRERPEGVRYDFDTQDLLDNPDIQRLMADRSLVTVAQSYLRCKPVFDVISMWWHTAYSKHPDKDAAQFYHFDMDRIKWLKFFIYLTDVGPQNGPHCFIARSHRTDGIPAQLRAKGYARLTDEEVSTHYPSERFIEFTAPRGTVIAVDTRGLHKGKHVSDDDRLVLQLQFSNSLFGGYYAPSRFSQIISPELEDMIRRYPRLYSNYLAKSA